MEIIMPRLHARSDAIHASSNGPLILGGQPLCFAHTLPRDETGTCELTLKVWRVADFSAEKLDGLMERALSVGASKKKLLEAVLSFFEAEKPSIFAVPLESPELAAERDLRLPTEGSASYFCTSGWELGEYRFEIKLLGDVVIADSFRLLDEDLYLVEAVDRLDEPEFVPLKRGMEEIDPTAAVREACASLQRRLLRSGRGSVEISLNEIPSWDMKPVLAIPALLDQQIESVIEYASDFIFAGGKVEVELARDDQAASLVAWVRAEKADSYFVPPHPVEELILRSELSHLRSDVVEPGKTARVEFFYTPKMHLPLL